MEEAAQNLGSSSLRLFRRIVLPLALPGYLAGASLVFLKAFDEFKKVAWYLHHTPEGRYYFDRQENLTKLLQTLAKDAPQNQIDDLIRHRLKEMFEAKRKTAYRDVLPLPRLDEVADRVRKDRVLLIVSPDAKIPLEEVQKFFEGIAQKNNLCILTGDKTAMASVEQAARQFYAAKKAENRIPKGHNQREELEKAMEALARYPWPGNIRELQNVIERAVILSKGGKLAFPRLDEDPIHVEEDLMEGSLRDLEKKAIERALEKFGGNRKKAAQYLGISLRALQYKIKNYGLT
jgi:hypothetical protein